MDGREDQPVSSLSDALIAHSTFMEVLFADVEKAKADTLPDDLTELYNISSNAQYKRRQLVRTIFSAIEGLCFSTKSLALHGITPLSESEKLFCLDRQAELSQEGVVVERRANLRFISNLRFTINVFCRAFNVRTSPDYSVAAYGDLQKAAKVRDRLTHPKFSTDLLVTNDELVSAANGFSWFMNIMATTVVEGLDNATGSSGDGLG